MAELHDHITPVLGWRWVKAGLTERMLHELTMRRVIKTLSAQRETLAKASLTILAVSSWGKMVGAALRLPGYIT